VFPCLLIANGLREAAGPKKREGAVINRMRTTNSWVGCPAVARPYAGGFTLIELHGAPQAATGIDARSSVALKPFPARPFQESP
jgi:hypothetical protein